MRDVTQLIERAMSLRSATGPDTPHWSKRAFARSMQAFAKRSSLRRSKVVSALAAAAGVTSATIYNWKNGTGSPSLDQALAMAAVMDCDLMDFTE